MHSKARLKKLKMVGCQRIDVELYKNFYAKLGVQILTTLVVQYIMTQHSILRMVELKTNRSAVSLHCPPCSPSAFSKI